MTEIIDIVSKIGIPFACFFAMFYLCDKTITEVTNAITDLNQTVAELKVMLSEKTGKG